MSLKNVIIFTIGAATGSVVTYFSMKKYCNKKISEEVADIRDSWNRESDESKDTEPEPEKESANQSISKIKNKPDIIEYSKIVKNYSHDGITINEIIDNVTADPLTAAEDHEIDGMEIVSPDEFGEDTEYEISSLYYTTDGVLLQHNDDDTDVPLDDTKGIIPDDFADYFGEYEDDRVYIKNDGNNTYYEIIKINERYSDSGE